MQTKVFHSHVDPSNRNIRVEGWDYSDYAGEARMIGGHYCGNTPANPDSDGKSGPKTTTIDRLVSGDFEGSVSQAQELREKFPRHVPAYVRENGDEDPFDPDRDIVVIDEESMSPCRRVANRYNQYSRTEENAFVAPTGHDDAMHQIHTIALADTVVQETRSHYPPTSNVGWWGLLRDRGDFVHNPNQHEIAAHWTPIAQALDFACCALYMPRIGTRSAGRVIVTDRADMFEVAARRAASYKSRWERVPGIRPIYACVDPSLYQNDEDAIWHIRMLLDIGYDGLVEWSKNPSEASLSRLANAIHHVESTR